MTSILVVQSWINRKETSWEFRWWKKKKIVCTLASRTHNFSMQMFSAYFVWRNKKPSKKLWNKEVEVSYFIMRSKSFWKSTIFIRIGWAAVNSTNLTKLINYFTRANNGEVLRSDNILDFYLNNCSQILGGAGVSFNLRHSILSRKFSHPQWKISYHCLQFKAQKKNKIL